MASSGLRLQRLPAARAGVAMAARLVAIALAFVVTGIILAAAGRDPVALAVKVVTSSFGSRFDLEDLGLLLCPLLFTGLAVAVALRAGLWNIGAEGQFYAGALAATGVGLAIDGPQPLMLVVLFAAGAAGGAAWILVPVLARAYANVNEIVTTLLLNFVAVLLVGYLATGPWRDPQAAVISATGRVPYEVPSLSGGLHYGLVVALGMVAIVGFLLRFTRWGYEVRISGASADVARYAGIRVRRRLIGIMLLSGAIAGMAGMIEVSGAVHRLQVGISNNFGYLGIIVAVLGNASIPGILASGLLIALVLNAGIILQGQGLTVHDVIAMTGLMLVFVAISEQVARYRLVRPAVAAAARRTEASAAAIGPAAQESNPSRV